MYSLLLALPYPLQGAAMGSRDGVSSGFLLVWLQGSALLVRWQLAWGRYYQVFQVRWA